MTSRDTENQVKSDERSSCDESGEESDSEDDDGEEFEELESLDDVDLYSTLGIPRPSTGSAVAGGETRVRAVTPTTFLRLSIAIAMNDYSVIGRFRVTPSGLTMPLG